jgi:UDP-N-acetylglucosamine:LPS N-acetylglucosamine transferase
VQDIRKAEVFTQQLFVFSPFITPDIFRKHWQQEIGVQVQDIDAVLGGQPNWSAQEARNFLQLEPGKTILIQGGDTPVWDSALRKVVPAFVEADKQGKLNDRELNVVINIPNRLADDPGIKSLEDSKVKRVRKLGFVPGGTIQELLPAIDFLVTRAGGGSVNDAVASRVPFVCVREPTQSQVEEILRACQERRLTRAIEPKDFEEQPMQTILAQYDMKDENNKIAERMKYRPNRGEESVAKAILNL